MGPLKEWLIVRKPVISDNCHPLARRCLEKMKFMSNSIVKGDDKVDMTLSCQHFFNFTNHKDVFCHNLQHNNVSYNIRCTLDDHFVC